MRASEKKRRWSTLDRARYLGKPVIFGLCLIPLAWIVAATVGVTGNSLGANPVEALLDFFGNWGLRFVMIALAVTPLRRITGLTWITLFRRMLGLFAAFYVSLHFLVYLILDQGLALGPIIEDVIKRPFITLGMLSLVLLLAMAATSTLRIRRAMGRRWQQLHNAVYLVGILGVWHYWWQVKKDITEPAIYAAILSVLLGLRIYWRLQSRSKAKRKAMTASPQSAV